MHKLRVVYRRDNHPCPSHGGPARTHRWTLRLNGVDIAVETERFRFFDEVDPTRVPGGLISLKEKIEKALEREA